MVYANLIFFHFSSVNMYVIHFEQNGWRLGADDAQVYFEQNEGGEKGGFQTGQGEGKEDQGLGVVRCIKDEQGKVLTEDVEIKGRTRVLC